MRSFPGTELDPQRRCFGSEGFGKEICDFADTFDLSMQFFDFCARLYERQEHEKQQITPRQSWIAALVTVKRLMIGELGLL